jgi:hypothetical protein
MVRKSNQSSRQMASHKRKAGRPNEYDPSIIPKMQAFFSQEQEAFRETVDKNGVVRLLPRRLPTFERFAVMVGVHRNTLQSWASQTNEHGDLVYPEFAHAYGMAKLMAESLRYEGASMKVHDGRIVALDLALHHDWRVTTHEGQGGRMNLLLLDNVYEQGSQQMLELEMRSKMEKAQVIEAIDAMLREGDETLPVLPSSTNKGK